MVNSRENLQLGQNVIIEENVQIGKDVSVGHNSVILAGTVIGDGVSVGCNCVLGIKPGGNKKMRKTAVHVSPLIIGKDARIANGVSLYEGSNIGESVFIGDHASVRENVRIGAETIIGRSAIVELNTVIGSRCTIQTLAYVTGDTVLEDRVFLGPCVSMSNDKYMGAADVTLKGPYIEEDVKVGNNASLLPGIRIKKGAVIGAGTVVTKDIEAGLTIVGAYGKPLKKP